MELMCLQQRKMDTDDVCIYLSCFIGKDGPTGELVSIIINGEIVEVTAQDSTIYTVYELPEQTFTGKIEVLFKNITT